MAKARIAVVGAGLMGHGIAQVFAVAGHNATIYDPIAASLDTVKCVKCPVNHDRHYIHYFFFLFYL